jgi:hypothetical protein
MTLFGRAVEEEEPEEDGVRSKLESKSISFHLMRWEGPPEMKLTTFSGLMSKWTMLILCKKLTASTISERICTRWVTGTDEEEE